MNCYVATTDQLFQFNGVLYEQKDGVAMGCPLGPLLANVFMCSLEEKLHDKDAMPEFYKRFVDDSCSLMPSTDAATDFLVTLNELHPFISFTMEIAVDGKLPCLGMLLRKSGTVLTTEVYRKPTDSGLLLHFRSHVDNRYKDGLVRTMIDRAAKLSSTKQAFAKECGKLRSTFQALQYPDSKFENIMKRFEDDYLLCNQPNCKSPSESESQVFRILLPYKDQKSADTVRRQLLQLSAKIHQHIQPVFTSKKIGDSLGVRERKPAIVNAWYTILNVVRVMRTMWDLLLGTFFNALKNIEELVPPLQNTLRLLSSLI